MTHKQPLRFNLNKACFYSTKTPDPSEHRDLDKQQHIKYSKTYCVHLRLLAAEPVGAHGPFDRLVHLFISPLSADVCDVTHVVLCG